MLIEKSQIRKYMISLLQNDKAYLTNGEEHRFVFAWEWSGT